MRAAHGPVRAPSPLVVTAPRPTRWSRLPWGGGFPRRPDDRVFVGVVAAYAVVAAGLAVTGGDGSAWAGINWGLYSVLAVATLWQLARVVRGAWFDRERLGWLLLALSALARFASGTVWSALDSPMEGDPRPVWLVALKVAYLALSLPAFLLFPVARWRGRDGERARIDGLTVIIGSALVGWYFAVGPLLRSPGALTAAADDVALVFGDALAVLLVARLHLRAARPSTRAAARWMLIGLALRIAPDILIWREAEAADFTPFGAIDAAWFFVWAMLWAGARAAETLRPEDPRPDEAIEQPYVSGLVPHAFLLASVAALLGQTVLGDGQDSVLFAVVSAVLALLLVTRQGHELDERDQLAHRLEREGARYEALLQYAYDAVVMFDRNGILRYASPATVRTFGPAIQSGDDATLWGIIHPDDHEALRAAIGAEPAPAGGNTVRPLRLRARDRLGRWRTFEGQFHDHRGDPLVDAIVLHGIDRTREARLAEGLAEAQPLEALGVLAGGLAHDLNNILTVVASHAELLDADAELDARGRDDVQAIRAASDRAQSLTRGLLTLSRKQGPVAAIAVADAVHEAVAAVPGATVRVAPGAAITVLADRAAVTQVIDGLLDAARADARADGLHLALGERAIEDPEATAMGIEPRLYVELSAGDALEADAPIAREEAVRMEAGHEWDLAPGDLALLIALAACRELGGTVLRERQGERARYAALLPAVHQ